jgi:hypothetical protein
MTYSQQFQDRTNSYNQDLQRQWDSATSNYQVEVANAGQTGEGMRALGALATLAGTKLEERKKYLINQSKLKYFNEGLRLAEQGFEFPDPNTPESEAEFDLRLDQAIEARRNGKSVEFGHRILNIGEHDRRHLQQGLVAYATTQFTPEAKQIIKDEGLDVSTNANIAGSVSRATTMWMNNNFMNFDEDIVFGALQKLQKKQAALRQEYTGLNNIRLSEERLQGLKYEIGSGQTDPQQALKIIQTLTNPKDGKPYNMADANKILQNHLKYLATNNALSDEVKESYFDFKPSWGGGKKLGELKEGFLSEIESLQIEALSKFADEDATRRATSAKLDANGILEKAAEFLANGERVDNEWQSGQLKAWRVEHAGQDESWVSKLVTATELSQKNRLDDVNEIIDRNGYIVDTHPILLGLSRDARQGLTNFIKAENEVPGIEKAKKASQAILDAKIKKIASAWGESDREFTLEGLEIKKEQDRAFERLIRKNLIAGDDYITAIDNAETTITGKYEETEDGKLKAPDFLNMAKDRIFESTRGDTRRLTKAVFENPDAPLGSYEIPNGVFEHEKRRQQGMETDYHPLIVNIADKIPNMSRHDVAKWFHRVGGQPYKAPQIEDYKDLKPFGERVDRLLNYGGLAFIEQAKIESDTSALTYGDPEALHPGLFPTNDDLFLAIGINEGTRTADGGYTDAYYGHTDPGDGAQNRGTVSAREGTPEEADAVWQKITNDTRLNYRPVLEDFGITPDMPEYKALMFNILDLRVQAPAAVGDFVQQIPAIIEQGITAETLGQARANAFINPATGQLDTTFADFEALLKDQTSRSMTYLNKARG